MCWLQGADRERRYQHPAFGNGAERMLNNKEIGCSIRGIDFNVHGKHHIIRAAQEGIVFSFKYGIDIMEQMGIPVKRFMPDMQICSLAPSSVIHWQE